MKNIAKNLSTKAMQNKEKSSEFGIYVVILAIAKITTNLISIGTSFYYLFHLLKSLIPYQFISTALTLLILSILEYLIYISVDKTFKFIFKSRIKQSIALAFTAILFYSISFFWSTNGIKEYKKNQSDQSISITKNYQFSKDSVIAVYADYLSSIKTDFANIERQKKLANKAYANRPGDLSYVLRILDKKKKPLTDKKFELIKERDAKIVDINKLSKNDLSKNTKTAETKGEKAYYIVAAIMILQIIITGILFAFFNTIFKEYSDVITDELKALRIELRQKTQSVLYSTIREEYNTALLALNQDAEIDKKQNKKGNEKQLGFTAQKTTQPLRHLDNSKKTLNYLNRHFNLSKKLISEFGENQKLSNQEIREIQAQTNAEHKSRSTIMKLFTAVQTAGAENLKINNNKIYLNI